MNSKRERFFTTRVTKAIKIVENRGGSMVTISIGELLLFFVFAVVAIYVTHRLVKIAKGFEDYKRIKDYLIIGLVIWLIGSLSLDSSVQTVGWIVWLYGFVLLLYKSYKYGKSERY
jgi:Ca2+/Na+ antiporter